MFDSSFFIGNRKRLSELLPSSLLCIPAHVALQESADLAYPFRQDSNFWYLTGLNEPDAILIIDTSKNSSTLLLPEQNEYQKEWDGTQSHADFKKVSGIDTYGTVSELSNLVKEAEKKKLQICYVAPLPERVEPYGFYANPARKMLEAKIKKLVTNPDEIIDIRKELARLRQVKQNVEIQAIQRAIDVTADTLEEVKAKLGSFKNEKEIENAITAGFFSRNSQGHAYEPIIAGGKNASIIHYNSNSEALIDDELLLLDVGAKVNGYAADISRTWTIGTPTKRQQDLYKAVLQLQDFAMNQLKPGIKLRDYQEKTENEAKRIFEKLGVNIDRYPHGFSHFLGLDVHDAGLYDEPLVEGAVLTVEPGIYLPKEGIGIRVEDNILVTKNGIKNLSEAIPKML